MEERRILAMKLFFEEDHSQSEVAQKLGVSRAAVCKWVSQYLEDDVNGLNRVQRSVNSPVLLFFLVPLLQRLAAGATKLGFPDDRWTTARLEKLLGRLTGLSQNRVYVKRTMNRIGWEYDPRTKSWIIDHQKHGEAINALKGRCLPPKFPRPFAGLEIVGLLGKSNVNLKV